MIRCAFALLSLPALCANAFAAGEQHLGGDWLGARSTLLARGVDVSFGYTSEIAANTQGGARRLVRYTDQWALGAEFDLQTLLGWHDARFKVLLTERNGRDLDNDAALGALQQVQEVWGRGQTLRLTQFWYEQAYRNGRVDWKIGRMTVGEDFFAFSCDFQNLTFCGAQPGNVRGELWYNWPVSQWATRVKLATGDDSAVQFGVYQVNPRYIDDRWARDHGAYPNVPSGTRGALIPIEFAWSPPFAGRGGVYRIGAWYDSSDADDVYLNEDHQPLAIAGGAPLRRDGRSGVYVNLQQQLGGEAGGRGTQLFVNATQSDRETAASLDRQIAVGVQFDGPFDARPDDAIGIAVGVNHVNRRVARGQRARIAAGADVPVQTREYVGEAFYGWKPLAGVELRPNLQYVRRPGGSDAARDVVVLGLKTQIDF